MQIDRPERGFSYATDAPLDMRMDPSSELTAAAIVNTWEERELVTIFRRYGEERFAAPIARAIGRRRAEVPFTRTGELVDVIKLAIPTPARFGEGHPAKRVFQALRIAVNDELGALEAALPAALEMLRPGGRLAVISFHSLEDRIVKRFVAEQAKGCTCPPDFPVCICGKAPTLRPLTKKPVRPTQGEVEANPRAASARLRAAVQERLMSTIAQAAPRRVRVGRGAFTGGVLWIVVIGSLLAGVVAINVLVLRLNVELDDLRRTRAELKADIATDAGAALQRVGEGADRERSGKEARPRRGRSQRDDTPPARRAVSGAP